jgi:hypothetical protein
MKIENLNKPDSVKLCRIPTGGTFTRRDSLFIAGQSSDEDSGMRLVTKLANGHVMQFSNEMLVTPVDATVMVST